MTEMTINNFKADGENGNGIVFAIVGDHENRPTDLTNLIINDKTKTVAETDFGKWKESDISGTLRCREDMHASLVIQNKAKETDMSYQDVTGSLMASGYDKLGTQEAMNDMFITEQSNWDGSQVSPTLTQNNAGGGQRMPDKDNFNAVISETTVRRLTPLECERLQGFDDNWTNIGEWVDSKGKKHKDADSPRYRALGNSIALPFWKWMAKRMVTQYDEEDRKNLTMASLFDGIGGFPVSFQEAGVKPIWASEIEEFCIAVTKKHFPEEEQHE